MEYLETKYKWVMESTPDQIYESMKSFTYGTGDIVIARADLIHAGPGRDLEEPVRYLMFCLLSEKPYSKRTGDQFQGNPQFFDLKFPQYKIKQKWTDKRIKPEDWDQYIR